MLLVITNLVLAVDMLKVVWLLWTPTLPPKKLIVVLMVVILCHIRVGNNHPWIIHTNTGTIIHHILGGGMILFLLLMSEAVLVLVQPTSTPKYTILE